MNTMQNFWYSSASAVALGALTAIAADPLPSGVVSDANEKNATTERRRPPPHASRDVRQMLDDGKQIFRYDTFDNESFRAGALKLHQAIAGANNGGVGSGVSPSTALSVGLKVDADALPRSVKAKLLRGKIDLDDPATTLALLQLNAVIGVKGTFDRQQNFTGVGIQCALCHSTVDDSFAPGIGRRLDGWPDKRYRTTPLGGLFARAKGGFYHDGRFADLPAVVEHYNAHFALSLSSSEKGGLVEYLKSL